MSKHEGIKFYYSSQKKSHWREIIFPPRNVWRIIVWIWKQTISVAINHVPETTAGSSGCLLDKGLSGLCRQSAACPSQRWPLRAPWMNRGMESLILSVGLLHKALCQVRGRTLFPAALIFSHLEKLCPVTCGSWKLGGIRDPLHSWGPYFRMAE